MRDLITIGKIVCVACFVGYGAAIFGLYRAVSSIAQERRAENVVCTCARCPSSPPVAHTVDAAERAGRAYLVARSGFPLFPVNVIRRGQVTVRCYSRDSMPFTDARPWAECSFTDPDGFSIIIDCDTSTVHNYGCVSAAPCTDRE